MTDKMYDALTYVHWLYWQLRCLQGSPESFERLFQDVAARDRNHFVRVRPYGNLGDRKVDGLYWGEGYRLPGVLPDQMKESETRQKISRTFREPSSIGENDCADGFSSTM
jgi:hypothetical protein